MNNDYLKTLGLAFRAGKLSYGEQSCRDVINRGHAKLILYSSDAGASLIRSLEYLSEKHGIRLVRIPETKNALGAALGKESCSVVVVENKGLAEAVNKKLCL